MHTAHTQLVQEGHLILTAKLIAACIALLSHISPPVRSIYSFPKCFLSQEFRYRARQII